MKLSAKAMVMASFAADSLSLGVHWIYDTALIDKYFGRIEHFLKPTDDSYHGGKERGELTHYGDQTQVLLDSLVESSGFKLEVFARLWQDFFGTYRGYRDQATRETLENFEAGKPPGASGSNSTELAGASRISPLVYAYREDVDRLVAAVRSQTAMTHNAPAVIESSEFFARTAVRVLRQTPPRAALQGVLEEHFNREPFTRWVSDGFESAGIESRAAISQFGQMCDVEAAFPGVIHLLARYEDDLKAALVENAMAGGDSAARGLIAGMVLGAHLGMESIPGEWLAGLRNRGRILQALEHIDSIKD